MKDFSQTLIPCSQISSIIRAGKVFPVKKAKKLEELLQKTYLDASEVEKAEALMEEKEACDFLSKSAKSFLIRRYVIEKYYRDYDAAPLQMVKGAKVEVDSLKFFCDVTGEKYRKNKKSFQNNHLIGTPDVVERDFVIEVKSSWDIFTFLKNVNNDVNVQYYWQLQGYLSLTDKFAAELVYCLISTPDDIIEEEYNRLTFKNPSILRKPKLLKGLRDSLYFNMRFDDIPKEDRILRFSVERNEDDIARIHKKVEQSRAFLSEFQQQHLFFSKHHRKSLLNAIKSEADDGNSED
jgi:hypothetical protein